MLDWSIATSSTGIGSFCSSQDLGNNASTYITEIFLFGSFNDFVFAFLTLYLTISKLFLLIIESENRTKCAHSRFSIHKQLASISTRNQLPVPDAPPDDHEHEDHIEADEQEPDTVIVYQEQTGIGTGIGAGHETTNGNENGVELNVPADDHSPCPSPPQSPSFGAASAGSKWTAALASLGRAGTLGTQSSTRSVSECAPTSGTLKKSRSISKSRALSSSPSKKNALAVSPRDAMEFHKKTADQNKIILLISKFFILLCCVVLSSQCVLLLFVAFRDLVLILYSMDTMINMLCLYLSFSFSDKYYNGYLCGRYCTNCCFPLIKTITMQCSAYERHQNGDGDEQTIDRRSDAKKCWLYCKCCCFGYCCDDKIDLESSLSMYQLAKFEVELMVMSKDNDNGDGSLR